MYIPLNDIASLVGWDMIDCHWDQTKNGFLLSSADFKTQKAINDYTFLKKSISPGGTINLSVYFKMDSRYNVEEQVMVLEVDFRVGGVFNETNLAEDIILLPRPDNFPKQNE